MASPTDTPSFSFQPLLSRLRATVATVTDPARRNVVVAYSGGLDSTVLLKAAQSLWPAQVRAIHVNHGLQPAADGWAAHCQAVCTAWNIPLLVARPDIPSGASMEAQARSARYDVFAGQLGEGDQLLMAHHLNDQLETLLFRLVRGSGVDGLGGMPAQRALGAGTLVRPWLEVPQSDLQAAAAALGLQWIEDPSNADEDHDRNYLRHTVLPALTQRWPGAEAALARSQRHIRVAARRLELSDQSELALRQADDGSVRLDGMNDHEVCLPILRLWLQQQGVGVSTESQLHHLWHDVVHGAADTQGQWHLNGKTVRRYQGRLHVLPALTAVSPPEQCWQPLATPNLCNPGWGELRFAPCTAEAAVPCLDDARLREALALAPLSVSVKQGGEVMHPAGRQHRRDLKRLLQECRLAPWWRDRVPLVYWRDELVAVGDLLIARGWEAAPGSAGRQLVWKKPVQ